MLRIGIVIREERRYFTVKPSSCGQIPWSHKNHGAIGTMESQEPWSHRYHGATRTMEPQVPWSHKTHGATGTMEYLDLVQSDSL